MKNQAALLSLLFASTFLSPTLRAANARMFEGVNLDEVNQTQRLQDMPEIYERDPANGRRLKLRKAVMQLRLGAAWLSFNPERSASYLNKVPGENAATYFGPIPGDAFELFKLEERFIAALRKDYGGDALYRIELMLRTGNEKLRERALRIMTAGLAPDISADTRAYHVAKFKELAANLEGEDVAPLRAAIVQTEQRIEELTVTLPDTDYQPGNDELAKQGRLRDWMKPGGPVPDAAWGEALNGLRAAAVLSTTEPKLGQEVSVWLLVENISDREIRFGCSDVMQDARAKVTRADGAEAQARSTWFTGRSPIQRHRLKPGERLTLAKKQIFFDDANAKADAGFGGSRVAAGPGEFRVRYESILTTGMAWTRKDDGLMHRTLPAKGEWSGRLATADTKVFVTGEVAAAAEEPKPAAAAPAAAPATRPSTGTKSILVNVTDATGKNPIKEFRVIAGVKFRAGRAGGPDIVTWQPHTLRVGLDGALIWPMAKAYDPMALRVEAEGYAPQTFMWLVKANAHDIDFELTRDPGIAARVLMPDGQPAVGATVALAMVQREAVIDYGILRHADEPLPEKETDRWRWPRFVKADAEGRFHLPAENDPTAAVLIVHERGVREMALAEFKKSPTVTLQPWGSIEGRAQWGDVPGTNRSISLSIHRDTYGYPGVIAQNEKTTTGADGSFFIERVLPGSVQLSYPMRVTPEGKSGIREVNFAGMSTHLTVQPGKNPVRLGGQGRTVLGRVIGRESWADVTFRFHPNAPHVGRPGDTEMWTAWKAWEKSSIGPLFFRDGLKVNADGTFEIPGVLPGNYQIFFTLAATKGNLATGKFVVPAETPGTKPEPHNIGELRCR